MCLSRSPGVSVEPDRCNMICNVPMKRPLFTHLQPEVPRTQGLVNVPIQHHPTIGDIPTDINSNRYLIPTDTVIFGDFCGCLAQILKMGHQSQPLAPGVPVSWATSSRPAVQLLRGLRPRPCVPHLPTSGGNVHHPKPFAQLKPIEGGLLD